ncbi:MAG: TonB-dependent receptor plug domain-containing protein [Longimicrobiales bacterium]|nr:TonB-dependent receptor plug domain-containing protein [Longimicrobiales bacterium]
MRFGSASGVRAGALFPVLLLVGAAGPLRAQDTTRVADTLRVAGAADTLGLAGADTLAADSAVIRALPAFPGRRPDADPGLVARWERDDILRARALTLLELLAPLAGAVPLRAGDFGAPEGLVMEGRAGGRLRVFVDGVEDMPLDGSVPDLAHVPLGGMARVEVVRTGGETRILLTTLQATGPDPVSVIEAGTGDLDTNVFRGTFIHPSAFGGALAFVFDRIDSNGPRDGEGGSLQSVWFRYLRPLGSRLTLAGEIRNRTAETELSGPSAPGFAPPEVQRLTRSVRLRGRIADGVVAEVFAAENKLDLTKDSTVAESPRNAHYGGRVGWALGGFWGDASVRHLNPANRPNLLRVDADGGLADEAWGGVSGRVGWDREDGETRAVAGVSAWTRAVAGISLFGSLDTGERGWSVPAFLRLSTPPDSIRSLFPSGSDATFLRAGARLRRGPLRAEASFLRAEVDSVLPLGNRVDRGLSAFPGDEADGFEIQASLELPLDGFALEGSLQQWEAEGLLRPRQIYRGGLTFHDVFLPTGNLEVTGSFVVEGRDPMLLPLPDPVTGAPVRVPFFQSWNAHLQVRVVTVRIFLRWENAFARGNLQDVPGIVLPGLRAMYGVRWTLTN